MRLRFPDDVRESFLLHNGMEEIAFFECYKLLPLEGVVQFWKLAEFGLDALQAQSYPNILASEPEGPVKNQMWNLLWIPVLEAEAERVLIDLDPAPGGTTGQVFDTCGGAPSRVLGTSYREFLSQYANDLEAGEYAFDPQAWCITRVKK
jgi:cell wall assembly regulator SMI1